MLFHHWLIAIFQALSAAQDFVGEEVDFS